MIKNYLLDVSRIVLIRRVGAPKHFTLSPEKSGIENMDLRSSLECN